MELSEKFKRNLESLKKALRTFKDSMEKDYSDLDDTGLDLIKNGRIQKFEYTTALSWKTSKAFIELKLGIVSISPKEVYRIMYREQLLNESEFNKLLKTIDDRNHISHVYREETYDLIYDSLPDHLQILQRLFQTLNK